MGLSLVWATARFGLKKLDDGARRLPIAWPGGRLSRRWRQLCWVPKGVPRGCRVSSGRCWGAPRSTRSPGSTPSPPNLHRMRAKRKQLTKNLTRSPAVTNDVAATCGRWRRSSAGTERRRALRSVTIHVPTIHIYLGPSGYSRAWTPAGLCMRCYRRSFAPTGLNPLWPGSGTRRL